MRPQTPQRPVGLFDLHGIGFSKGSVPCEKPVVPNVMILADGKELAIPDTPIRCSNANGLTDQIRYQVYGPLGKDTKLEVKASDPGVKFEVSQIVEGRATVKCTYNGLEKIYLIN
jgi:hypothetical protein